MTQPSNPSNRRRFIAGAVASASTGALAAVLPSASRAETLPVPTKWGVTEYQLVVAGAGAAGCVAALEAAEAGLKVLLLEMTPMPGGSSALSSGWIRSHSTKWHQKRGLTDSAEAYAKEGLEYGAGTRNPAKMEAIAAVVPQFVNRLIDGGVKILDEEDYVNGGPTLRQAKPEGGGASNMRVLAAEVRKNANITLKTGAKLVDVYKTSTPDTLVGVLAEIDRKRVNVKVPALVIATGGYSRNEKFVAIYARDWKDARRMTGLGNDGSGIFIASAQGAGVANLAVSMVMANLEYTKRLYYSSATFAAGSILVNKEGRRFVNELELYGGASKALLAQPEAIAYQITCEGLHPLVDKMKADGVAIRGDTVEELARNLNVPTANLKEEIDAHNEHTRSKQPDRFGRKGFRKELVAPFYAIRSWPVMIETGGGFLTNEKSQAVDFSNQPVMRGLYGAGAAAFGEHFGVGYRSGDAMAYAGATGIIAGREAAKYVKSVG